MKFKLLITLFLYSFSSYSQEAITIGKTETIYSELLKEDKILEIHKINWTKGSFDPVTQETVGNGVKVNIKTGDFEKITRIRRIEI